MTIEERIALLIEKADQSESEIKTLKTVIESLSASMVQIQNDNLTLMEALADLGGSL